MLFLITNYLNSIGQLNKSYKIIENYQLNEEKNYNFYSSIKINYLLSKTKLEEVCNYHEEITMKAPVARHQQPGRQHEATSQQQVPKNK